MVWMVSYLGGFGGFGRFRVFLDLRHGIFSYF